MTRPGAGPLLLGMLLAAVSASAPPALADFAEGLAAYDAGDLRVAYTEWLSSAEAGDRRAQVALAGLLESGGPGLARDLPAAARWYRRAARGGDAVAQMNLGQLYAEGRGVTTDPVRALAWFSLAAAQGRNWAARRESELRARMSPQAQAAAAKLVAGLR